MGRSLMLRCASEIAVTASLTYFDWLVLRISSIRDFAPSSVRLALSFLIRAVFRLTFESRFFRSASPAW